VTAFSVKTLEPRAAAVIRAEVPLDQITEVFGKTLGRVFEVVASQGLTPTGAPFSFYPSMPTETVKVIIGVPIAGRLTPTNGVESFELPGGDVVTGVHTGPYESLSVTYEGLMKWAAGQGIALSEGMWESYLSDPMVEPDPHTWQTEIFWPLLPSPVAR
jgi:effector-binding domain-containing protein